MALCVFMYFVRRPVDPRLGGGDRGDGRPEDPVARWCVPPSLRLPHSGGCFALWSCVGFVSSGINGAGSDPKTKHRTLFEDWSITYHESNLGKRFFVSSLHDCVFLMKEAVVALWSCVGFWVLTRRGSAWRWQRSR